MKYVSIIIALVLLICCESNKTSDNEKQDLELLYKEYYDLKKQIDIIESKSVLKDKKNVSLINVIKARVKPFNRYIMTKAEVKTEKNVIINPKANGVIEDISVKRGDRVKKGQIMVKIDSDLIQKNIDELRTNLEFVNKIYTKKKTLWDKKIGSEIEYLNSKNDKESLEKKLKSLLSQKELTIIKAPFNGVIDYIFSKKGEMASPSIPLLRLLNIDDLYLDVSIPERYVNSVKVGATSFVKFPFLDKVIESKVKWVSNYIDQDNRTFKAQISFVNKYNMIKINILADVKVNVQKLDDKIVIPPRCVKRDMLDSTYVLTVDMIDENKGILKKTFVKVGSYYENDIVINSGIIENNFVVLEGVNTKEGDIVEPNLINY